jgi:pimeloyl-ACP methyl ester carboxylesterase
LPTQPFAVVELKLCPLNWPLVAGGGRLPALLQNVSSVVVTGGPHAIIWTHAHEVNQAMLDFAEHHRPFGTKDS